MKWIAIFTVFPLALISSTLRAQQVIAQDSAGLVVEVKEKYGGLLIDTATVVIYQDGMFVLVIKEKASGWFPASFHSVRVLEKLSSKTRHPTASSEHTKTNSDVGSDDEQ